MEPRDPNGQTRIAAGGPVAAGAATGVLAAVTLVVFMAAVAAFSGGDALAHLHAAGATFRSSTPLTGPVAVAWGLLLHLAVGALVGIAFSAVVPADLSTLGATVLGAGAAVLLMALAVSVVTPRLAPALDDELRRRGGSWIIGYALFGVVLGLAPALRRRRAGAPPGRPPLPLRPRTAP